jgi:hypothetical protein
MNSMHDIDDVLFCLYAFNCDGRGSVARICLCLTTCTPSENPCRQFVEWTITVVLIRWSHFIAKREVKRDLLM